MYHRMHAGGAKERAAIVSGGAGVTICKTCGLLSGGRLVDRDGLEKTPGIFSESGTDQAHALDPFDGTDQIDGGR